MIYFSMIFIPLGMMIWVEVRTIMANSKKILEDEEDNSSKQCTVEEGQVNRMADKRKKEQSHEVKAYKREVRYRVFMIFLALLIMASVCVAWFANNRQVQATEMSVQLAADGFELAAEGSKGSFDTYTEEGEKKSRLSNGFSVPSKIDVFQAYDGKDYTGYKTSGSATSISWAVIDGENRDSHINNVDGDHSGIDPGASGSITFYIIPNGGGDLTVTLKLSLIGLDDQDKEVASTSDVQQLLEHHLLLFAGFDNNSNSYNHWISSDADAWNDLVLAYSSSNPSSSATLVYDADKDTLTWTGTNLEKDKAYPVTIYWIWPDLLGQYIFAGKRDEIGNHPILFPKTGEGEKVVDSIPENLFSQMSDTAKGTNSNTYLMWKESNSDQTTIEEFKAEVNESNLNALRSGTGNRALYNKICTYYNKADQYIGENIRYVRLQLDAE